MYKTANVNTEEWGTNGEHTQTQNNACNAGNGNEPNDRITV